jgi:DnaJ-domain-containing protein 1
MVELLRRLAHLTRAHLHDFLEPYWGAGHQRAEWGAQADAGDEPPSSTYETPPSFDTHRSDGLPYSDALADSYRVLDLPFGAPLEQVAKRWKDYLKKCHPDRYANDPQKQAEATELTQELTRAYESIRIAWKQYRP